MLKKTVLFRFWDIEKIREVPSLCVLAHKTKPFKGYKGGEGGDWHVRNRGPLFCPARPLAATEHAPWCTKRTPRPRKMVVTRAESKAGPFVPQTHTGPILKMRATSPLLTRAGRVLRLAIARPGAGQPGAARGARQQRGHADHSWSGPKR